MLACQSFCVEGRFFFPNILGTILFSLRSATIRRHQGGVTRPPGSIQFACQRQISMAWPST